MVVAGSGPSLVGRVHLLEANPHQGKVEELLLSHSEVFSGRLGRLQAAIVKLPVTETTSPKFYRPRQVPYAVREKIEEELFDLTKLELLSQFTIRSGRLP